MNISQVKALHLSLIPDSHFFDRKTMVFFGNTTANFGVKKLCSNTYIIYRKKLGKHCYNSQYEFNIVSGKIKTYKKAA